MAAALVACSPSQEPSASSGSIPTTSAASTAATPSGSPVLGIDWGRSNPVERPEDFSYATEPPLSTGTGRSGHPLHFPGQAMMADVARLPGGSFVSVGYAYPGWHPVAWTSTDGTTWSIHSMGSADFTFPVSLAVESSGTVVAVGRSGSRPVAWTSRDGASWEEHDVPILGDGKAAERMTSVLATADGFVAGGSVGPELFERHARLWTSSDGAKWQPVADESDAFADAEVRSIADTGHGLVAVGLVGSAQRSTGSVAWRSEDGRTWKRVDDPALATGRAVAVLRAPFGGLVAVGSDLDEHEAFAWTSPDGRTWTRAPSEPSRQYHGKIRMTDVTAVGSQLIAVGNYVGLQRGTAISWVSDDGMHWREARSAPVQEQGEIYAVTPGGPGLIAVGSFGAPDDYIPTVWLSPTP
jgi:hypothetical protein